jgi:hypothetical protein
MFQHIARERSGVGYTVRAEEASMVGYVISALGFLVLLTAGAVNAAPVDFTGSVKAEAGYKAPPTSIAVEIAVDVVYDEAGIAWGTMRYGREAERIYANASCVGKFSNGEQVAVSGKIAKVIQPEGPGDWVTFEFDVKNQKCRVHFHKSEKEALENCKKPTVHPADFVYGYVIVK